MCGSCNAFVNDFLPEKDELQADRRYNTDNKRFSSNLSLSKKDENQSRLKFNLSNKPSRLSTSKVYLIFTGIFCPAPTYAVKKGASSMMFFSEILEMLSRIIWGPATLLFLPGLGLWLSVRSGWFQFRRIGAVLRCTVGSLFGSRKKKDGVSPFQALTAALAGTIGTGNVVGVATALAAGGPGALFWMWITAFLGMMTKFAEVALAVQWRRRDRKNGWYGGPMEYISDALGWRPLACCFAAACLLSSIGTGSAIQMQTVAQGLQYSFSVPPLVTGLLGGVLVFFAVSGGLARISSITAIFVPFMALFYLGGGMAVLIANRHSLPAVFALVGKEAFSFRAAGGGIVGSTALRGMRYGIARGVFSNEAGQGSAPIAHAGADAKGAVEQGMWGIFEVFIDTVVICGITGLVILSSDGLLTSGLDGAALTAAAFERVLGRAGTGIVSVSLVFFAFSTVLGWSYYGERAVRFLFPGERAVGWYRLIYLAVTVLSSCAQAAFVWNLADVFTGLMTFPNLLAVAMLSNEVVKMIKRWEQRDGSR